MTTAKLIGLAVVEWQDRFLVGTRPAGVVLAGCAEFPGGKCLPGETPSDCALRECREETGLDVQLERELDVILHDYPHGRVELHFWLCRPARAADVHADHQGFRWTPRGELGDLPFPEANRRVLELLAAERAGK